MEYDYIIVGAGTAGPVVARRLAEGDPGSQVLLVEAGDSNEGLAASMMPMGIPNLAGTEHVWGYKSEPLKFANDRVIDLPRGRFLGGSSGMNATMVIRGQKADYDEWVRLGNEGWGWDDVLPLFKKVETFIPPEGFSAASEFHGTDGPIKTSVHPPAPISEAVLKSYIDRGFEYKPDMFVTGEAGGVGHVTRTIYEGVRTSGADYVKNKPDNLHILFRTTVLRVVLDDSSSDNSRPLRAVAVEAETKGNGQDAPIVSVTIRAGKEIILSAGAYNTPVVLMHSGIGPKQHLEEFSLNVKLDLPGVGQNLSDHVLVFIYYLLNTNLTYDNLIFPPGAVHAAIQEWAEKKSGVMSRMPFGSFALKRLDDRLKERPEWKATTAENSDVDPMETRSDQPHIELTSTEFYAGSSEQTDFPTRPDQSVFGMMAMLTSPLSRGSVRLSSSSPHDKPKIDHNYFSSELDLVALTEGIRLAHEIVLEGAGTKPFIAASWPEGSDFPREDEEWKKLVKERANTCYHPSCTCKMGPDEDNEAVVDARLRVRGVSGLRVADVSVMPKLISGHPQWAAYMIGEKAALIILEDHPLHDV